MLLSQPGSAATTSSSSSSSQSKQQRQTEDEDEDENSRSTRRVARKLFAKILPTCAIVSQRSLWSAPAQQSGDGAFSGTRHLFSNTIFPGAPKSGVPRKPSGLPPQSKSESLLVR
jgi:hypothetical protein